MRRPFCFSVKPFCRKNCVLSVCANKKVQEKIKAARSVRRIIGIDCGFLKNRIERNIQTQFIIYQMSFTNSVLMAQDKLISVNAGQLVICILNEKSQGIFCVLTL